MKIKKIFIVLAAILMIFAGYYFFLGRKAGGHANAGEHILYDIDPTGNAEYSNFGTVDLKGKKVNLVTFTTKILLVEDTQKIYSDPESGLPCKIERTISRPWAKEYITREYDQGKFTVLVKNFKDGKAAPEQTIKANGPIQDAVLFPFYLSRIPDLKIGWSIVVRIPEEIKLELISIDPITVPAGKFQAYHLKSTSSKLGIWINKDTPHVPLKIQGKDGLSYALVMKKYSSRKH